MQRSPADIGALIQQFLADELSPAAREELDAWIGESVDNQLLFNRLTAREHVVKGVADHLRIGEVSDELFRQIITGISAGEKEQGTAFRWWRWVAAASVILLLGAGAWFLLSTDRSLPRTGVMLPTAVDIAPGKKGAILTLADGAQVSLDSVRNGVIALQGGATASVVNGVLHYKSSGREVVYNTMSTPKGRQFQLTLPDGTEVWLNSASSIRYPTVFAGRERRVEVSGEAYFTIAKNANMPFRLLVHPGAEVEVLGTQLNINAYENEANITTTLIEGAVAVSSGPGESPHGKRTSKGILLKPGQQARVSTDEKLRTDPKVVDDVDMDQVVAWKNGLFKFDDIDFASAMRQLERWYDIEVVYEKAVPTDVELYGKITKDISLNGLLKVLQKIGVKCRLEGRRLLILQ